MNPSLFTILLSLSGLLASSLAGTLSWVALDHFRKLRDCQNRLSTLESTHVSKTDADTQRSTMSKDMHDFRKETDTNFKELRQEASEKRAEAQENLESFKDEISKRIEVIRTETNNKMERQFDQTNGKIDKLFDQLAVLASTYARATPAPARRRK